MSKRPVFVFCCVAGCGVAAGMAATLGLNAGGLGHFTAPMVQEAKERFALAQLEVAAANKQASGVIKEEDTKKGILLLQVDQVCAEKGGSAVGFVEPYCKTALDPVDCGNGRLLARYRVQQRACRQDAH